MRCIVLFISFIAICCTSCSNVKTANAHPFAKALTDSILHITSSCPGEIGVAVIINNKDTVTVNNHSVYPMMSVFKLHQCLAICNRFENDDISLDTLISIRRDDLDLSTWSPMIIDHPEPSFSLSVRELLRYTLTHSDNNASNLMFERLVSVAETDNFIAKLIPRKCFQIAFSESEMADDNAKAYSNYTSPLGAAILINLIFTEKLTCNENQEFIKKTLGECLTGQDRIVAPLIGKHGISIAHKTGSGYTYNGILTAHNDLAYISLPNGTNYSLAVFVKDFRGNESEAAKVVAAVSETVYHAVINIR